MAPTKGWTWFLANPTAVAGSNIADNACKPPCRDLDVGPSQRGSLNLYHPAIPSTSFRDLEHDGALVNDLERNNMGLLQVPNVTYGSSVSPQGDTHHLSTPAFVSDSAAYSSPSSYAVLTTRSVDLEHGMDVGFEPDMLPHEVGVPTMVPSFWTPLIHATSYTDVDQYPPHAYLSSQGVLPDLTGYLDPHIHNGTLNFDELNDSIPSVSVAEWYRDDIGSTGDPHISIVVPAHATCRNTVHRRSASRPIFVHGGTTALTGPIVDVHLPDHDTRRPSNEAHVLQTTSKPVAVTNTAKARKKGRKRTKISTIIGEQFLSFQCEGRAYIGICLGDALEADLQALVAPEYQGFFHGLGQKVTWVIVLYGKANYTTKQRNCRHVRRNAEPRYFARERIVREVAKVTQDFLKMHRDFYTDAAFRGWPPNSTIDNFGLVELRKVSCASVQIVFEYRPSISSSSPHA